MEGSREEAKKKRLAAEEALHEAEPEDEEYARQAAEKKRKLQADVHKRKMDRFLRNPDHYDRVWQELEGKYGDRYTMTRAYLRSLQRIRSCRDGDHGALRKLAARLHDVMRGLQDESCVQMCSGPSLEVVTDKLPTDQRNKWGMHAFRKITDMLTLVDLDAWLQQRMIGHKWLRPSYENRDTRSLRRNESSRNPPRVLATAAEDRSSSNRTISPHRSEAKCQISNAAGQPLHECGAFISS